LRKKFAGKRGLPFWRTDKLWPRVLEYASLLAHSKATDKQPVIPSVPWVYPGGGGFIVTWPMSVGDEVLLVFSDDSLDKYLQVGGGSDIDPADDRRHSLTDAVAFAGIRSLGTATSVATGAVQIGTNGGTFQGVALGADIKTYLDGHTHAVACPPGGGNVLSSAPSASVTGLPLDPSPAASATVKVTP
jgi:hypothetical protein